MTQISTAEPVLLRQDRAGIATLTLNRPQARNALSVGLMTALEHEIGACGGDCRGGAGVLRGA